MIVETLEDWPQRSVVLNKSSPNFICTILCKSRFNGQQVCLQIRVRVPICITSLKLKVPTKASSRKQKDIFQIGPTRSSNICIKFIFCLFPHLSLKDGRGWVGMGCGGWVEGEAGGGDDGGLSQGIGARGVGRRLRLRRW